MTDHFGTIKEFHPELETINAYLEQAKLFSLYANKYAKQCRWLLMASSTYMNTIVLTAF